MKYLTKYLMKSCAQKYQPLGFIRRKSSLGFEAGLKIFARMNGDFIQHFSFDFVNYTCSVDFASTPLCCPPPVYLCSRYSLDEFLVEKPPDGHALWEYFPPTEELMQQCADSILDTIDRYLIPYFDACKDCETTLSESIKILQLFQDNYFERVKRFGIYRNPYRTVPELIAHDTKIYYTALKAHDFSIARQWLNSQILYIQKNIQNDRDAPERAKKPLSIRQSWDDNLAKYTDHLARIDANDTAYLDALLKENERQTMAYLTETYKCVR